jgi:hypothetical protein
MSQEQSPTPFPSFKPSAENSDALDEAEYVNIPARLKRKLSIIEENALTEVASLKKEL